MPLTLEFILESITGQPVAGSTPVGEVVIDSRKVTPGGVFVALKGEHADGHQFVGDALARGAAAALIERPVEAPCPTLDLRTSASGVALEPPLPTPVCIRVDDSALALQEAARQWVRRHPTRTVGVTGSVGKSTVKEVIAGVLARRYRVLKSEGSYNNELGIPMTVLRLDGSHQRMVLEMSMYTRGEIALLTGIAPPQVGVVTLVAPVHLSRAGTLENILRAKTELVEALPPDGVAILNRDDERVMTMVNKTQARILTYGLHPEADFRADQVEGLGLDGVRFWLHHADTHLQLHLPMLGRHSVYTALAAAAVGTVEGLSWEEVGEGLRSSKNQLRLIVVAGPRGSTVLDDTYNASPTSVLAALDLLADLDRGRRVAVLGDMLELGSYEEEGHARVGARAGAVADLLVTVGERARIIAREAIRAGLPGAAVCSFDSAEDATGFLLEAIQPGDAVLVKGSRAVGMERIVRRLQEEAGREE